jgi:ABC-type nitrate/sulfonate/bicarbonate transport system substrate-binding protein
MRGLGKGEFDIASTAFDNVLAWSGREGTEIIAIAQVSRRNNLCLFVRPEIREWHDLRGKRLAADAVDTAYALVLRKILLAHGLDLDRGDYELVAVGAGGRRRDSLLRGETFAAILSPPLDPDLEAAGMRLMADHRDVLPDYPGGVLAVSRAWADSQREVTSGFLAAWLDTLRWARESAHQEEAVRILAGELNIAPDRARDRLHQLPQDGSFDIPGLQTSLDLRLELGLRPPMGTDLSRYYDASYLLAASNRE